MNFTLKAEQVSSVKFKIDLESVVRIIAPDYGSVKKEEFIVGRDYKEICFVDSDVVDRVSSIPVGLHPVVEEYISSGVDKNVFLITVEDSVEDSFDVGKIEVNDDKFICIDSKRGRIRVQFEGLGDRTNISEWLLS